MKIYENLWNWFRFAIPAEATRGFETPKLRGPEASRLFKHMKKMPVIQTFIRKASDGIMLHLNDWFDFGTTLGSV